VQSSLAVGAVLGVLMVPAVNSKQQQQQVFNDMSRMEPP
jgi:hypothetical protein